MKAIHALRPGDSVRPMGCHFVGKVIHISEGYACVDFESDGQIMTGVYFVEDLQISAPKEAGGEGERDRRRND